MQDSSDFIGHGYRETAITATDFHRLNTDLRPPASVKIREDPWLFEGEGCGHLLSLSNLVLPQDERRANRQKARRQIISFTDFHRKDGSDPSSKPDTLPLPRGEGERFVRVCRRDAQLACRIVGS